MSEREQTIGEEIANSVTHGAGLVAAIAGLLALIVVSVERGNPWAIWASVVYGISLVLLYLASTLYHALAKTRARGVMRRIDHSAIYLLIAGTYTPFALVSLRGKWGWWLFGLVWGLAVFGTTIKAVRGPRWPVLSTTVYLLMGWLVLPAIGPLMRHLSSGGVAWLFAGGLFSTGGVVFFAMERLRFSHAVWHLFVLGGSVCHYVAVMGYVV
jgi:hemolysin III